MGLFGLFGRKKEDVYKRQWMEFTWLCDAGINWENRLLKIYDKTGLSGRGRLFFKANGERTAL